MKATWCTIFLSMFFSFLYMFWATTCPSLEETTVFMRHLVLVILHGCLVCRVEWNSISTLHTRQSSIQNNKYQVLHKYSCFSQWWAHSRPKHVEKRNKHTKKNCAPIWLYLQDHFLSCFHQMETFTIKIVYQIMSILFQAVTTLFRS
jgi:hypothetical protein